MVGTLSNIYGVTSRFEDNVCVKGFVINDLAILEIIDWKILLKILVDTNGKMCVQGVESLRGGILITGILRIYFIREKNFAHNFA